MLALIPVLLIAGYYAWLFISQEALPTTDQLLNQVHALRHEDPKLAAVDIRGQYHRPEEAVSIRFHLLGNGKDHAAAYLIDPYDNTPLLASVDGTVLLYDVASNVILFVPNTLPRLSLGVFNGSPGMLFETLARATPADAEQAWRLWLDLPALVRSCPGRESIVRLANGQIEWKSISSAGRQITVRFSHGVAQPVNQLEYGPARPNSQHTLTLDTIQTGDAVVYNFRPLPKPEHLEHMFKVAQAPFDASNPLESQKQLEALYTIVKRTLQVRQAIRIKSLRASVEQQHNLAGVDWSQLASDVTRGSANLRQYVFLPSSGKAIE